MHTEIKFNNKVAYHGKKWGGATGIHMMRHDTIDAPSPNGIEVVNITPTNRAGLSSTSIELPVEQLPEIITEMMRVAGINPVEFAKKTLVANGYVRHFWSKVDIQDWATERYRPLTEEELERVAHSLENTDCSEYGISWQSVDDTITSTIDWDWEASDMEDEEDESDEFRHIINQYTPDEQ